MGTAPNQYQPDYAVRPGWIIEERLAAQGISHAEFARRCGRSPKLISEIIAGTAPIAPKTALQFEKVLGLDAGIWLGIEAGLSTAPGTPGRSPGDGGVRSLGQDVPDQRVEEAERNRYAIVRWGDGVDVAVLLRRGVNCGLASQVREGERRLSALPEFQERRIVVGYVASAGRNRRGRTKVRRVQRFRVQAGAETRAAIDDCSSNSSTQGDAGTLQQRWCRVVSGQAVTEDALERRRLVAITSPADHCDERSPQVGRPSMVQPVPRGGALASPQQEERIR